MQGNARTVLDAGCTGQFAMSVWMLDAFLESCKDNGDPVEEQGLVWGWIYIYIYSNSKSFKHIQTCFCTIMVAQVSPFESNGTCTVYFADGIYSLCKSPKPHKLDLICLEVSWLDVGDTKAICFAQDFATLPRALKLDPDCRETQRGPPEISSGLKVCRAVTAF